MEKYVERMKAEKDELHEKIIRAQLFIDSGDGDFMERYLLGKQIQAMSEYRDVLSARLIYADKKDEVAKEARKNNG